MTASPVARPLRDQHVERRADLAHRDVVVDVVRARDRMLAVGVLEPVAVVEIGCERHVAGAGEAFAHALDERVEPERLHQDDDADGGDAVRLREIAGDAFPERQELRVRGGCGHRACPGPKTICNREECDARDTDASDFGRGQAAVTRRCCAGVAVPAPRTAGRCTGTCRGRTPPAPAPA